MTDSRISVPASAPPAGPAVASGSPADGGGRPAVAFVALAVTAGAGAWLAATSLLGRPAAAELGSDPVVLLGAAAAVAVLAAVVLAAGAVRSSARGSRVLIVVGGTAFGAVLVVLSAARQPWELLVLHGVAGWVGLGLVAVLAAHIIAAPDRRGQGGEPRRGWAFAALLVGLGAFVSVAAGAQAALGWRDAAAVLGLVGWALSYTAALLVPARGAARAEAAEVMAGPVAASGAVAVPGAAAMHDVPVRGAAMQESQSGEAQEAVRARGGSFGLETPAVAADRAVAHRPRRNAARLPRAPREYGGEYMGEYMGAPREVTRGHNYMQQWLGDGTAEADLLSNAGSLGTAGTPSVRSAPEVPLAPPAPSVAGEPRAPEVTGAIGETERCVPAPRSAVPPRPAGAREQHPAKAGGGEQSGVRDGRDPLSTPPAVPVDAPRAPDVRPAVQPGVAPADLHALTRSARRGMRQYGTRALQLRATEGVGGAVVAGLTASILTTAIVWLFSRRGAPTRSH